MKTLKINCFGITLIFGMLISCVELTDYSDPKDSEAPAPVSNVQVENLNGGAKISYTLPSDKDLLGAKVSYALTPEGEMLEKYASMGIESIELEGFGDTNEHPVTVYAVDKSGNVSEGITKTIKPLTPAVELMRETLIAGSTFGGVTLSWKNTARKDMGVSLFIPDPVDGEWKLFDTYFSNSVNGEVVFRPFEAVNQQFRIEMFDRWQNNAQPLEVSLTPLAEILLPGRSGNNYIWNLFDDEDYHWFYRGEIHNNIDVPNYVGRPFALVHDGRLSDANSWWNPGNDGDALETYIPGAGQSLVPFPLYFTVDMGRKGIYSRFNIIPRLRSPDYSAAMPIDFEIWGTNNPKLTTEVGDGSREANLAYWTGWSQANGTDAWKNDGWTKIATCKLVLSSGESKYVAGMALSDEDLSNYKTNGFEFPVNEGVTEGFRYLRWVINDTNTGQKCLQICEIRFWGNYSE